MSSDYPATQASLEQFLVYPFDTDRTYQQGLASILTGSAAPSTDSNSSPHEHEELVLRIKVFYFNKFSAGGATGSAITVDQVKAYEPSLTRRDIELGSLASSAPADPATTTTTDNNNNSNSQILSFAEIKELIETGRLDEIPNNKIIPDTLNEEAPSESVAPARKKPWETASATQSDSVNDAESQTPVF